MSASPPVDTPMMRQYRNIKKENADKVLFFRMGDFYEMFEEDAVETSRLLNLTLTRRQNIPMCGIPYHASRNYIARLLKLGKRIAICEQTELPERGKGLAKREVVEVITPGTLTDEAYLDGGVNNYLLAVGLTKGGFILSAADISTGDFFIFSHMLENGEALLRRELHRLDPREILIMESCADALPNEIQGKEGVAVIALPDWRFDVENGRERLCRHFQTQTLKGFGLKGDERSLGAAGVILEYLEETAQSALPHIKSIATYDDKRELRLDESAFKNLEILKNSEDGGADRTLFSTLRHTVTAMGERALRRWLTAPLIDRNAIEERFDYVESLKEDPPLTEEVRRLFSSIPDLERLNARVSVEKAHGKDMVAIKEALTGCLAVGEALKSRGNPLQRFYDSGAMEKSQKVIHLLGRAIADEPPLLLNDGGVIRDGYDDLLDDERKLQRNSKQYLNDYMEEEKLLTGISTLKVKYNKIIGYFFEVSKGQIDLVPQHFIRRQSLVNAERFSSERLMELETRLSGVAERVIEREQEIFIAVRREVKEEIDALSHLASAASQTDALQSFATVALQQGYCRPQISDKSEIAISGGRHPVVEGVLEAGEFIPNDILFNNEKRFALITGPNMAGKSTVLRQTALIVFMAHCGSFVPADRAIIGITDQIFCRVGASDNLSRGESTFMVEMQEAARILNRATERSLVIMDEVGRGTGTEDGFSIAWAISEDLLNRINPITLFATHYHELTSLSHPHLQNLSMAVADDGRTIIFLKKLQEGPAAGSYGIHVAALAGIPQKVVTRAKEIMDSLEKDDKKTVPPPTPSKSVSDDLFGVEGSVASEIRNVTLEILTPLEALTLIDRWKKELEM